MDNDKRRNTVAEAAGVVNAEGRANDSAFRELIADSEERVQEITLAVRDLVFDVYPETVEVVWPKQRSAGWGVGPKKFSEQFAYVLPHKRHVTLGFYHGGELPDPADLLPDEGGKQVSGKLSMRSLRLERPDDVAQPAVRELVDAAVRHQVALVRGS
jgi:Domain of unknown function (DU1801)